MPICFYEPETNTKAKVTLIHYQPEILSEEKLAQGIEVSSIPTPENKEGKQAILYIDPTTSKLWYEYIDRPLTPEEEIKQLKQELIATQNAINFLLGL